MDKEIKFGYLAIVTNPDSFNKYLKGETGTILQVIYDMNDESKVNSLVLGFNTKCGHKVERSLSVKEVEIL